MPTLEKVRILNLGVTQAKFVDLTLPFNSKNTYVLAGNATGKSTIIGFILNTLAPFSWNFPRGDSAQQRKIVQYVDMTNPGVIAMKWKLDTSEDVVDKYLTLVRTLSNKTGTLRDTFFYQENRENLELGVDQLSIIENDQYISYNKLSRILRTSGYAQIDSKGEWIDKLDDFSINKGLVERLLQMNESENATKELIRFKNEKEFIEYLVEDIKPVPDYANEYLQNLQDQYTQLKSLPKIKDIIKFLEQLKGLMQDNLELYENHITLSDNVEERLYELVLLNLGLERIIQQLNNDTDITQRKKEELKQRLHTVELELQEKKEASTLVRAKFLNKQITRLDNELEELEADKQDLNLQSNVLTIFNEIKLFDDIKQQIQDLEDQIEGKLEPIQAQIEEVKTEYKNALLNQYFKVKKERDGMSSKRTKLRQSKSNFGQELANLEAKINHLKDQNTEYKETINEITAEEAELFNQVPQSDNFDNAYSAIKVQVDELKDTLSQENSAFQSLKNGLAKLKEKQINLDRDIKELKQKDHDISDTLTTIHNRWEVLAGMAEFKKQFPTLDTSIPQFMVISPSNLNTLQTRLDELQKERLQKEVTFDRLEHRIQYFDEHGEFPPLDDLDKTLKVLKENNISAFSGWSYFRKQEDYVDQGWFRDHPYVFDGIVVQGSPSSDAIAILREEEMLSEIMISIIEASTLSRPPDASKADSLEFLIDGISWKYDTTAITRYKEVMHKEYTVLENELTELEEQITAKSDYLEKLLDFQRHSDEDHYLSLKSEKDAILRKLDTLDHDMTQLKQRIVRRQNEISSKEKEIEKLDNSLEETEKLRVDFVRLESDIKRRNELKTIIIENKEQLEEVSSRQYTLEEKLAQIEDEITTLDDVIEHKGILVSDLKKEFQEVFREEPKSVDIVDQSYDLTSKRNEYQELLEQINENEEIRDLTTCKEKLQSEYRDINQARENFIRSNQISASKLDVLVDRFQEVDDLSAKNTEINKKKDKITSTIARKNQQLANSNAELNNFLMELDQSDLESGLSEEVLSDKYQVLKNSINELQEDIQVLDTDLDQINKQLQEFKEDKSKTSESMEELEYTRKNYIGLINRLELDYDSEKVDRKEVISVNSTNYKGHLLNSLQKLKRFKQEYTELNENIENYLSDQSYFRTELGQLITDAQNNAHLRDNDLLDKLQQLKIHNIPTIIDEADNEIQERKLELSKFEHKVDQVKGSLNTELSGTIRNIIEFQRAKISAPATPSFNNRQPVSIEFDFAQKDIEKLVDNYLQQLLTHLDRFDTFPEEWTDYKSLLKFMLNEFLDNRIRRIQFAIPEGRNLRMVDFEDVMRFSGGQTAIIAISLFCYVAHFKIKFNRMMQLQDRELLQATPISIFFINDNPMGAANREDFVRVQLDIAKSLNVQLIYFSGIGERHNIEEFENKVTLLKKRGNRVEVEHEVQTGLSISHTPIREVNYEQEITQKSSQAEE